MFGSDLFKKESDLSFQQTVSEFMPGKNCQMSSLVKLVEKKIMHFILFIGSMASSFTVIAEGTCDADSTTSCHQRSNLWCPDGQVINYGFFQSLWLYPNKWLWKMILLSFRTTSTSLMTDYQTTIRQPTVMVITICVFQTSVLRL